jgi:hypothetical protein
MEANTGMEEETARHTACTWQIVVRNQDFGDEEMFTVSTTLLGCKARLP